MTLSCSLYPKVHSKSHWLTDNPQGYHNAKFVVTSGTGGCRYNNLQCHQWWQKLASWWLFFQLATLDSYCKSPIESIPVLLYSICCLEAIELVINPILTTANVQYGGQFILLIIKASHYLSSVQQSQCTTRKRPSVLGSQCPVASLYTGSVMNCGFPTQGSVIWKDLLSNYILMYLRMCPAGDNCT